MHHDIIRKLGGAASVGSALRERGLKVEDVTVRSWSLAGRGIPAKYWIHISAIANERGEDFSLEAAAQAAAISPLASEHAA